MARVYHRTPRRKMKEDTFILKLFEAGEFIRDNVQQIVIGVVVVAVAVAAGMGWSYYRESRKAEAGRVLAPALTAVQQSRYADAIPIFERVKNDYASTASGMEAAIGLANAYFQTGKYEEARRAYEAFLDEYGGDDDLLTVAAQSGLAACDEQAGKYAEAARQYEQLARDNPSDALAPPFLYDAARCYQAAQQTDQAKKLYDEIVNSYASSRYAQDAKAALSAY